MVSLIDDQFSSQWEMSQNHFYYSGKIRDNIHKTIQITPYEKKIIDTPQFQRLRRINQTAFVHLVFPSATHTRFSHSIGTMHLAGLFYSSLIDNQSRLLRLIDTQLSLVSSSLRDSFHRRELQNGSLLATEDALHWMSSSSYLKQCLRFAALLHDCGHAPFSHSGEKYMMTWNALFLHLQKDQKIPLWLKEPLMKLISQKNEIQKNQKIRHEVYSLFIIANLFSSEDCLLLSPQMGQDVCSLLELSILPHPEGDLAKSGLRHLFHEMISGEVDVDRMDYLIRDSVACGVVYGYFDSGRLLDSVAFYQNVQTKEFHLAFSKSGVFAYEDFLRARWSMYQQVYFHKTATSCEAMLSHLQKRLDDCVFPFDLQAYVELDDLCLKDFLLQKISPQDKASLAIVKDLLDDRHLWKRIYEESNDRGDGACQKIMAYLEAQKIPAELVETSTTLTRLTPRMKGENQLKVVVKDMSGLKHLSSLEEHSFLAKKQEAPVCIRRIYVSHIDLLNQKINVNLLKQKIEEELSLHRLPSEQIFLSIQSCVSYGHVGNSASMFPLQRLGTQVWPMHTVFFSNHTGYGDCAGAILSHKDLHGILKGLQNRGALEKCQAVLSGYMGSCDLGRVILDSVDAVKKANPRAIYCCDPVIGDMGSGVFVKEGIPDFIFKHLLPQADIITPNHFELEYLSQTKINDVEQAIEASRHLIQHHLGGAQKMVLVTSFRPNGEFSLQDMLVLAVTSSAAYVVQTPCLPVQLNGTGDITAALFTHFFVKTSCLKTSLEKTVSIVYSLVHATWKKGSRELVLIDEQEQFVHPTFFFGAQCLS